MFTRISAVVVMATCLVSCRGLSSGSPRPLEEFPKPPLELLKYRNDSANPIEGGGLLATDTYQLYRDINSYPMLCAVILDKQTEPEVLPYAIERALLAGGPTKVFGDARRAAAHDLQLFADGPRRQLLERSCVPHVWVSGSAFINDRDIPRSVARKIFEQIAMQVSAGASFEKVLVQMQDKHSYSDGATRLTRIGNYGDWVLSSAKRTGEPFRRWTSVPESHVERLLDARAGDTLILEDDNRDARCLSIYYIREVYRPG